MASHARLKTHRQQKAAQAKTNQLILGVSALLVLVGVLWLSLTRPSVPQGFAPDFSAQTLTGETVKLSDYRGKPVMLNFWATWCPPCRAEMPAIQEAYEQYQAQGFTVLAINNAEPASLVAPFAEQLGLAFPIVMDGGTLQRMFGIQSYPTSVFIRPDGAISATHNGGLSASQLERYIQASFIQ